MRISDWSSDVCSSDLVIGPGEVGKFLRRLRILLVPVGVQLLGKLAIRGLDLRFARALCNAKGGIGVCHTRPVARMSFGREGPIAPRCGTVARGRQVPRFAAPADRKSPRLNSSH